MTLKELLQNSGDYELLRGSTGLDIAKICVDSRSAEKGYLFVAIKGVDVDGHEFIEKAVENGVGAIMLEDETFMPAEVSVPVLKVKNSRKALAHLAAAFYGFPARKLIVIGVTGTDGKTTTSTLIHHILNEAGHKTGLITSINAVIGDRILETGFHTTTPDALSLQKYLAEMVDAGSEYAVIETSSHGLAQYRVEACEYDIAALTNITSEHLDYHRSREEYIQVKAHLFELLSLSSKKNDIPKISILNKDDPSYENFHKHQADMHISFGIKKNADYKAEDVMQNEKLRFSVHATGKTLRIESPLLGTYNVYNILAAIAVARSQNISWDVIVRAVSSLRTIKGRMENVLHKQGNFMVIIDFAHTANALEQALLATRSFTKGKIHVVFGSAGLRDVQKRREMGKVAGRFADRIYITTEDPRTESIDDIIQEIAAGCIQEGRKEGIDFFKIPDREKAIEKAIISAHNGDTVITCGKAHETTMCYGIEETPWSEYDAAQKALKKRALILTEKKGQKKE
ncbi:MAG: UDP-N-acetylmuramoyl-L-alanyl-D-glutamate--2,6-diaminopimelate ligase [Candidatus Cloacimonetes bacterium]|nr:UDP-N-acetylmuramoyl-L-alanyl-D-glutamate--2,6-diaminopimelate ligase [Candidatus Cloacimonadota bacterium]